MTNGRSGEGERETPRERPVSREEQGDLLADAVTGFFTIRPGDSDSDEESKDGPDPIGREDRSGSEPPGTLAESDTIPESIWEQKMAWAKARARDGRLEEAAELYRELLEEQPDNVRALNNLGVLLDEMGDAEGAVARLRAAKGIEPRNQEVLGNLGAALGALGRYGEAEEELRLAYRIDPSNLQVRANLGILLFRRGLYEAAVHELASVRDAPLLESTDL